MKFVITQVQGCVDGLEWLKVNVDLLFLAKLFQCTRPTHLEGPESQTDLSLHAMSPP